MERYSRQILFSEMGKDGQEKVKQSKVIIIGCGALGTNIANILARAGVGYIKIVDRDYIELSNLQRQVLFDEDDIKSNLPKAVAAQKKLKKINSDIIIESEVVDVSSRNILSLCKGMDLILDATDNFSIRFLINDISAYLNTPWIYGGVIGSIGMTHTIIPGETPCFRCIYPNVPSIGSVDTCDTVGVLNSVPGIIASFQATEAIKILSGNTKALIKPMRFLDIWNGDFEEINVAKKETCQTCKDKDYEFLKNKSEEAIYLCGKNSIQINPKSEKVLMENVIERLKKTDIQLSQNNFFLRFFIEDVQVTLFNDGRAILKNISDIHRAKSLYSRYVGL